MTRYCICRKSDSTGFMIGCEKCNEWFHGRCININKKKADKVKYYYCEECRRKYNLSIIYNPGCEPESEPSVHTKLDPHENQKPEKKVEEKNKPAVALSWSKPKQPNLSNVSPIKASQNKRKFGHKAKKGHNRRQCSNPNCTYESRTDSKYCSDECGLNFNRLRYETMFLPKWKTLEIQNHSSVRWDKFKELKTLDEDTVAAQQLIKNLKEQKEELERKIKIIKEEASKLYEENVKSKKTEDEDGDGDADIDETEEILTGDQARTFCITCGHDTPLANPQRHWFTCHKKQEAVYNFTADVLVNPTCEGDENPKLYCQVQDKKTKRYCMHLESACPQHSNWQSDKDEVCGCPLNISQELVPDGNYCLELKRACKLHYHWDKFLLAQMNMQRVHAFSRHDALIERKKLVKASLDDTYGGVVGVMLHNTINHQAKKDTFERDEVDVDMED